MSPSRDCEGGIVAAHTLSASSVLRPISRKGHIYSLKHDLYGRGDSPISISLRGISDASVFNGFCAKHDSSLFSPIENLQFACTKEQLFLYAFRAVAREAYLKRKQAQNYITVEEFKSIHGLEGEYGFTDLAMLSQVASLKGAEEIESFKSRMDDYLLSREFGRMETTVIEFRETVPVVASFAYAPDFDFEGEEVQDLSNLEVDVCHLVVNLIPKAGGGSYLLLSHEDVARAGPRRLIESLVSQSDISSSVFWLLACHTENFAFSPDWYESLSEEFRDIHLSTFMSNIDLFDSACNLLKDRLLTVEDWGVEKLFKL